MTRRELLRRIEKLEEAVRDIQTSCSCLRKEIEVMPPSSEDLCGEENFNCEPGCGDCGEFLCICEPEDDTIYCPEPPEEPEEPIEEEDHE